MAGPQIGGPMARRTPTPRPTSWGALLFPNFCADEPIQRRSRRSAFDHTLPHRNAAAKDPGPGRLPTPVDGPSHRGPRPTTGVDSLTPNRAHRPHRPTGFVAYSSEGPLP